MSHYDSRSSDPSSYRYRKSDSGLGGGSGSGGGGYEGNSRYSSSSIREKVEVSSPKKFDLDGLTHFEKNFYVGSPSVGSMSEDEVEEYRIKGQITVEGKDVLKPVKEFSDIGFPVPELEPSPAHQQQDEYKQEDWLEEDQQQRVTQRLSEMAPDKRQTVKFLTIGAALLVLSGLSLTRTVIFFVIVTPLLVLFSHVLVPAGIVFFLTTVGFLLSGRIGVVVLSVLTWIYNYVSGKQSVGSDKVDHARMRLANKARDVKDIANDYGHHVQNTTLEVSQQA